jgi:phenylalanine-4-hydroxylase
LSSQRVDQPTTAADNSLVDQEWATRYNETSHATWASLFDSIGQLSRKTSCSSFIHGQKVIQLGVERIPKFEELSEQLSTSTGWEIIGANGFVPDEIFFTQLANKRFPMSCEIRSLDGSQFQEYPDLFHDVYGHVTLLIYPEVSEILQFNARSMLKAIKLGRPDLAKKIASAYWFTIEVGLVKEHEEIRVYGAAIASSPKEIMFATADKRPNLIRFDLDRVMRTEYDMLDVQAAYFVLNDIDELKNLANVDFFEGALSLESMPTLALGEICPSDELIQLGSDNQSAKSKILVEKI